MKCSYWLNLNLQPPGWFNFIKYAYKFSDFWGWEHGVKVWWVTRSKPKISRPHFFLVIVAKDMMCLMAGNKFGLSGVNNLLKKWSVKQTTGTPTYRTFKNPTGFDSSNLQRSTNHQMYITLVPTTNIWLFSLWKFVAENLTENFTTLKITLKNNIKESFTENYTEKRPLLFRNAKKRLTYQIFIQTKYHFKS